MVIHHRIAKCATALQIDYNRIMNLTWVFAFAKTLFTSSYMSNLHFYIDELYKATDHVYPRNKEDIFKAFELTKLPQVKVVIFGNEPYQSVNSNGLAFGSFSAGRGLYALKQSKTIQNCLYPNSIEGTQKFNTTLRPWANQGVLLLNTSLVSELGSHMKHEIVFRNFIREIVKTISDDVVNVVFVFTSREQAEKYEKYIDTEFHTVLKYDGITEDSSIFDDINIILEDERGFKNTIIW